MGRWEDPSVTQGTWPPHSRACWQRLQSHSLYLLPFQWKVDEKLSSTLAATWFAMTATLSQHPFTSPLFTTDCSLLLTNSTCPTQNSWCADSDGVHSKLLTLLCHGLQVHLGWFASIHEVWPWCHQIWHHCLFDEAFPWRSIYISGWPTAKGFLNTISDTPATPLHKFHQGTTGTCSANSTWFSYNGSLTISSCMSLQGDPSKTPENNSLYLFENVHTYHTTNVGALVGSYSAKAALLLGACMRKAQTVLVSIHLQAFSTIMFSSFIRHNALTKSFWRRYMVWSNL